MYAKSFLAVSALLSLVAAVPMNKRDIVWVTETAEDIVTVPVTKTVWVTPGEVIPTEASSHFGHHFRSTVHVQSTMTVAAAPSSSSAETSPSMSSSYAPPSSSSVYVAPTTSSVYVAPTSAAPTTSQAPAPSYAPSSTSTEASSGTSAASGSQYTGDITHYDVGLGSCGWTSTDGEAVVAIPTDLMNNGPNPNNNPLCGTYITISYAGQTHQAKIVDTCAGCLSTSIDLSPTLFTTVAPNGNGRVSDVVWWFDS